MRLTGRQVGIILETAREIYGDGVKVYLFGSRTDDAKRGGDIDLVVRSEEPCKGVLAKVKMVARLKYLLGDRKIDIIGDHEDNNVAHEVVRTGGILLSFKEKQGNEKRTATTAAGAHRARVQCVR